MTLAPPTDDALELLMLLPQCPASEIEIMDDLGWGKDRLDAAVEKCRTMGLMIDTRADSLAVSPKSWRRAQVVATAYHKRTYGR